MSKNEWNYSLHNFFSVSSLNNNINPIIDLLIDSIDKFSFGENESITDKTENISNEEKEKLKKISKNNFLHFKQEIFDENLNNKLNEIEDILIKNEEIKNNKKDNNDKICGLFTREDFNVKIDSKHKHDQLNDSFEKKYHNPLEDLLNDDNNDNGDILKYDDKNNNKNNDIDTKSENTKIDKNFDYNSIKNNINENNNNKEIDNKNNNINKDVNISENNVNNDNDVKQIKSTDTEIPINGNILANLFPSINNNINENKNNNENNINENNNLKNNNENKNDEECESPRLGGKENIEEKEENKQNEDKNQIEEIKKNNYDNDNNNDNIEKITNENILFDSKNENKNDEINDSNNYEKQMNLPLSLNVDFPKINNDSSNNQSNKIINNDNNNKNSEYFNNNKLSELKENSFEIKNNIPQNISNINEDTNKKILELTEKLEKSEKDVKQIREENLKLMEVVDFFKNLQGEIEIRKNFPKSGKNSRSETPKTHKIKKRCYTPTLSTRVKNFNNDNISHHIKTHSYSNNNFNNDEEGNRLHVDYIPIKQKSYRELHGKDFTQKNKKIMTKRGNNYKNKNNKNNYINRNTIYLTGSNNIIQSPYLNKNMNYFFNNNNDNNLNIKLHSLNNFYPNNNHFCNNNCNNIQYQKILNNIKYNNISQKQIMQLPYNEQPLFYESKPNFFNNNNNNHNPNNNININQIDNSNNYSLNDFQYNNTDAQKINKNNISLEHAMNNKEKNNCKRRNKNKLLDFKDFQIIFEETEKENIKHVNTLNNEENKEIVEEENKINEEKIISEEIKKINKIKNNSNTNGRNNEKNNFWLDIGHSNNNELINKVKEDEIQKCGIKENVKYTNEINIDNIIINNTKEYLVPFYLINTSEMFNNIINYHHKFKK